MRRITAGLLGLALLLLSGCPTSHLFPNRRLDAGEVLATGAVDFHLTPPFPSRIGVQATLGFGGGEAQVLASASDTTGLVFAAGGRVHLGPLNLLLRGGGAYDLDAGACNGGWCPVWEARLTTVSTPEKPFYFGLHDAGAVVRNTIFDANSEVTGYETDARTRFGLVMGYEKWWTRWGLQVELLYTPLEYDRGEVGLLRTSNDMLGLAPWAQMAQVVLAVHYGGG